MDTRELKEWIVEHDINKRMIDGFWYYLNNYKEDHPEDFNKDFQILR